MTHAGDRPPGIRDRRRRPARAEPAIHPDHAVQFYYNDSTLFTAVAEFLGPGLESGVPALVIATESHFDGISASLRQLGIDVPQALEKLQLTFLDARATLQTFTSNGRIIRDR